MIKTNKNINNENYLISPSLICSDLCNLEYSVKKIKEAGCRMIHIDIIDGVFSPSMPLGLDTLKQLRTKTDLDFDIHIMSVNNDFFVNEAISLSPRRICFQIENELHISKLLSKINAAGIEAGLALSPATPISFLQYALHQCDFLLLMRINPGYAYLKNEKSLNYMYSKLIDLRTMLDRNHLRTTITIDGRVSFSDIEPLINAGATTLVGGTNSFFSNSGSISENYEKMMTIYKQAILSNRKKPEENFM